MRKLLLILLPSIIFFGFIIYGAAGFYVAYSILKIDHTCGWNENSTTNTWSTKIDAHEYTYLARSRLRSNFLANAHHLDEWQNV